MFVLDGDDKEKLKFMGILKIFWFLGEMIYIKLNSKVEWGKNYYLFIEFYFELNRGLFGFYLSIYNFLLGEVRWEIFINFIFNLFRINFNFELGIVFCLCI